MKTCRLCKETKPLIEFYQHKATGRRQSRCRLCQNIKSKEWSRNNREKANELTRDWIKRNPDYSRRKWLTRYAMTIEQYDSMLASQNGGCAICGVREMLRVDHCHATKKVRGILCNNCNLGIGNLQESRKIMEQAIAYLTDTIQ